MPSAVRLAPLALAALVAACSRTPAAPPPAPAQAPVAPPTTPTAPATTPQAPVPVAAPAVPAGAVDLSGEWQFSIEFGTQTVTGTMTLSRSQMGFGGPIIPDGMSAGSVNSTTIRGDTVRMLMTAPDGAEAVMQGTLAPDRRSISGTLAYQDQLGNFVARRP